MKLLRSKYFHIFTLKEFVLFSLRSTERFAISPKKPKNLVPIQKRSVWILGNYHPTPPFPFVLFKEMLRCKTKKWDLWT